MKTLLYAIATISGLFGLLVFFNAGSAVHEIEAMIGFLIMTVAISGVYIADSTENKDKKIIEKVGE